MCNSFCFVPFFFFLANNQPNQMCSAIVPLREACAWGMCWALHAAAR